MIVNHDNVLDIRDLAIEAQDAEEILGEDSEELGWLPEDREEAGERLACFKEFLADAGRAVRAGEEVSQALESLAYNRDPTLIAEDYFEQYARELAESIGAVNYDHLSWPCNHIGWEAAAGELMMDYSPVELDGRVYLLRD